MATSNSHRDIYKATFSTNGGVIWKEKFKQTCLAKVKQTKDTMLHKMRTEKQTSVEMQSAKISVIIPEIITQEWQTFKSISTLHIRKQKNTNH